MRIFPCHHSMMNLDGFARESLISIEGGEIHEYQWFYWIKANSPEVHIEWKQNNENLYDL